MGGPRVAAHRGGAGLWPENSAGAVREAVRLGVPLVEVDVHLALDGTAVVIHDATLDRTTDSRGPVAQQRWNELRHVRLRDPAGALTEERLPSLGDVLAILAPTATDLLLELKGPGPALRYEPAGDRVRALPGPRYPDLEARVAAALAAHGMTARATILAFNPTVLQTMQALAPAQSLMLLVSETRLARTRSAPEDAVEWAIAAGAGAIGLEHTVVGPAVVAAARRGRLPVNVWTVNDEAAMQRFVELGVDVLTTDRPDLAQRLLAARVNPA